MRHRDHEPLANSSPIGISLAQVVVYCKSTYAERACLWGHIPIFFKYLVDQSKTRGNALLRLLLIKVDYLDVVLV